MKRLFEPKLYDAKLTIPNIITAIGILLLIPYVWGFLTSGNRWIMFSSLFLAGCSDLFDGLCARKLCQKTRLGEFIDPLRDRLLLLSVLTHVFYISGIRLLWGWGGIINIIILELMIFANNIFLTPSAKLKVHLVGKIRQAGHLFFVGLAFLGYYFQDIISLTGIKLNFSLETALSILVIFSAVALVFYVRQSHFEKN